MQIARKTPKKYVETKWHRSMPSGGQAHNGTGPAPLLSTDEVL